MHKMHKLRNSWHRHLQAPLHSGSPHLRLQSDKIRHFPTLFAFFAFLDCCQRLFSAHAGAAHPQIGLVPSKQTHHLRRGLLLFFRCTKCTNRKTRGPARFAKSSPSIRQKHHARHAGHPCGMEMGSGPWYSARCPRVAASGHPESTTCGYFQKNPTLFDTFCILFGFAPPFIPSFPQRLSSRRGETKPAPRPRPLAPALLSARQPQIGFVERRDKPA